MPYCPKCDMEFVDGIITCSDCKGTLMESKELADAMTKQEQEEANARRQAEYEAMEMDTQSSPGATQIEQTENAGRTCARTRVYVKKSQQYDDLKSSVSAFVLVGGILLGFSVLCWAKVINLPITGMSRIISQTVMTVLGFVSLAVAAHSAKSAKTVSGQIADEENATRQLTQWFTASYSGSQLDAQILAESGELGPEELSLRRFELIQDILITTHDITDQAYVDLIAEDLYGKLYQD